MHILLLYYIEYLVFYWRYLILSIANWLFFFMISLPYRLYVQQQQQRIFIATINNSIMAERMSYEGVKSIPIRNATFYLS